MQWPKEVQERVYIFNSFFLKKLTENTANSKAPGICAKANHERVKKWTKVRPLVTHGNKVLWFIFAFDAKAFLSSWFSSGTRCCMGLLADKSLVIILFKPTDREYQTWPGICVGVMNAIVFT